MNSAISNANGIAEPWKPDRPALWLATAVLGCAFFVAEHELYRSRLEAFAFTADEMAVAVESGDLRRQVGFLSVAALGAFFLVRRPKRWLHFTGLLACLVLLYVAWCFASLCWAANPEISGKRAAVMGLCVLGVLGISRQLTPRDLCLLALWYVGFCVVLGVAAELALGTFCPWSGEYRFGGTLHPNSQGTYCAILCLSALCMAASTARKRRLLATLCIAAAMLLFLTKSRTAIAGLTAALCVLWICRASARAKVTAAVGAAWAAAMLGLAVVLLQPDAKHGIQETLLLGRIEDAESLSGRVPLWNDLLGYAARQPLLGYGYGGFWSTARIEDVSESAGWAVHTAHSAYLDVLLSVGAIGAGLLILAVAIAAGRAAARYSALGRAGDGFVLGLLVFGTVNAALESGFIQPVFVPFVAACGLGQLAFCREERE